jgi:hypothetical protein
MEGQMAAPKRYPVEQIIAKLREALSGKEEAASAISSSDNYSGSETAPCTAASA